MRVSSIIPYSYLLLFLERPSCLMAARLFWKREDGTTGTMTGGNEDDDDDDHLFFCPTEVYSSQGNNNGGIVWQNVAFETSQQHIILEPFSFQVANGRLCAILGEKEKSS